MRRAHSYDRSENRLATPTKSCTATLHVHVAASRKTARSHKRLSRNKQIKYALSRIIRTPRCLFHSEDGGSTRTCATRNIAISASVIVHPWIGSLWASTAMTEVVRRSGLDFWLRRSEGRAGDRFRQERGVRSGEASRAVTA
ncbi:hypothetical protein SCP_0100170 [Sparassis crispa]|uniref:Uncharacterized protein n=1 Tax=Sparassis crispa TaxID=139825 RepID=A0A401G4P3_9APHY|nr:hypothetical protein SCP_0100170 [Sparassis crispa]GBE77145.1 hypothetical protein SCP_0100170 [Sparassis crispa]